MADIRQLIEESKQAEPERRPYSTNEVRARFYRPKMPNAAKADAQHAYFYDRLLEELGRPAKPGVKPDAWKELTPEVSDSLLAYAEDRDGFRTALKSNQEYTGVLGEGSPVNTAMTWMQSLPGMVYGAGQMLGNAADYAVSSVAGIEPAVQYPDAAKKTMAAVDTFSAPGQELARIAGYGPEENSSAWSEMRRTRKKNDEGVQAFGPERVFYKPNPWGSRVSDIQHSDNLSKEAQATRVMLDGQEMLEGARVPSYLAAPLGMLMDDIVNPVLNVSGLKAAKTLPALARWAATEFLPSQAMLGIGAAANYMQKSKEQELDELIDRLGDR